MAATHNVQALATLISDFIVKQRGVWEHEHWEALCGQTAALGVELDDDLRECLGLLLENMRVFYFCMPAKPRAKAKAKAKTKTKAKVKAKVKAKTKAAPAKTPSASSTPTA